MPDSAMRGIAQTVLGPVPPESLGPTMTHEHLLINFGFMLRAPQEASQLSRAYEPLTLQNLGWVRYNHYSNRDNLLLLDEETAIAEAALFKRAGGGAIVDATTLGIGRDPLGLARIARATGLNIVMGAGYYVDAVHPRNMDALTENEITRQMIGELTVGVGDTGLRAGIIGEIGCTWPLTTNERKVLRASANAHRETGAAILIHPGRNEDAPKEILAVLSEAGADISRVIMGHLDRTVFRVDTLLDIASTGCYMEYDLFGNESSYYPLSDIDMPSDAQRLDYIQRLIEAGHRDRLVIAHDICTKHRLVRYGGHGYAHILENIVPRMRRKGFSEEDINAIIVANPARVLAFA
ncbi:MAG: phosphotriesterase-related protein [Chloroflexi bacterium]|nr:phosphotriesterase-related protein [Chloroflexota bacterium]